jgi:hypothetical protein
VVPSWPVTHEAGEDAVLFVSDRPAQGAHLFREERRDA